MIDYFNEVNCAVTICDRDGKILYMNERSREVFAKHGDLIGHNLFDCHSHASAEKIRTMLETGVSNAYTISKNDQRKMIYQTPWRINGEIVGMIEISMVIDQYLPHYNR